MKEVALMADPTELTEQNTPGVGSAPDSEPPTVLAADERGLAMVFTGIRHFRH